MKEEWPMDHPRSKKITQLVAEMICTDLQPYSMVEDKGFRNLLKYLVPNYRIPSRKHFSEKVVPLMYESIKEKVKYDLANEKYICLTTDGWTCQHTMNSFFSLTARYVTAEFEVKNVTLQVTHFKDSHTGINISKFLRESVNKWAIGEENISLVLTDNAANVLAAMRELGWDNGKHFPCIIHTLQLCIQSKIFKEQRAVSDMLAVFRALAGHFHHSSTACEKLKEIQRQLNLPIHTVMQDVATRWNSTFYMLERFVEQRKAIALYCISRNQPHQSATENQWQLAEMLVCILAQFEKATLEFSKDEACISQIIPFVHSMSDFLNLAAENATGIKTIAEELKTEFAKRFSSYKENKMLIVSMLMDPRFKLDYIDEENISEVKEIFISEYYQFCLKMHNENPLLCQNIPTEENPVCDDDTEGSDSEENSSKKMKLQLKEMDIYTYFNRRSKGQSSERKRKSYNPVSVNESIRKKW